MTVNVEFEYRGIKGVARKTATDIYIRWGGASFRISEAPTSMRLLVEGILNNLQGSEGVRVA